MKSIYYKGKTYIVQEIDPLTEELHACNTEGELPEFIDLKREQYNRLTLK